MVRRNAVVAQHPNRHHLESKSRGVSAADLKKKKVMKKSASIKRTEIESLRSSNLEKTVSDKQPGKPPPPTEKQLSSPMAARTPNYMKSTSSSEARKEQRSPQMSSSSKFKNRGCESKAITKTVSSLKTMRTLTKNPSFKIARASVKRKCSPVAVLCESLESQRATCSSTLKDCKFPAYLSLNPGGTESEGTSAIKVCPYTYCSLNGHHRPPLPPLKCFLSARRRMVKAQKGIKVGCDGNGGGKVDDDLGKSCRITLEEEEGERNDFFVDIFCVDDEVGIGVKTSTVDDGEEEEELDEEMVLDLPICGSVVDACESLDGDVDLCSFEIESEPVDCGDDECSSGAVVELEINHDGDELMDDDEESLELDVFSDDGESPGSSDCLQGGLNGVSQETEPEQELGEVISDSTDDDKKSLQQENDVSEIVASAVEVVSDSTENSDIGSKPEAVQLTPGEEGCDMAGKVKSKDEVCSEAEDDAKGQYKSKTKKPVEESNELGDFNPCPPNFLPLEEDPEGEKVDLRHQEIDERRNTEEWMMDYALRHSRKCHQ